MKLWYLFRHFQEHRPRTTTTLFFMAGFSFDLATLGEVDELMNLIMLAAYLFVCCLLYGHEFIALPNISLIQKLRPLKEDLFHFCLGSLLSAFTLFYFKSSSLASSAIFMLFMASLLILNESENFRSLGPWVKSSLVSLCMISYTLYLVPVLWGETGRFIFILCLILSFLPYGLLYKWLLRYKDQLPSNFKLFFWGAHSIVCACFLIFYLFKAIPPIPLSIRHMGIYHQVKKITEPKIRYELHSERPWWRFWHHGDQYFEARPGERLYFFARIFSPGGFKSTLILHWQWQTPHGEWLTSDKIPLKIEGGRRQGFRGYAYKANYSAGPGRVLVETQDGLEIGRLSFELVKTTRPTQNHRVEYY